MAENTFNGTVAGRHVSRELKKARIAAGITAEAAAAELGVTRMTVSRIENNQTGVSIATVKTLCSFYNRPDLIEPLVASAKAAKTPSWYREYSDVIPDGFDAYIGLEETASEFRWYEQILVPGIVQTEGYARTLVQADNPDDTDEEIDRRVQLRLKRQALLTRKDNPAHWNIILNEAILHRPIGGPAVMAEQLRHLLTVADLPAVTLGVVPNSIGNNPGVTSGAFVLMDFPTNGHNGQPTEPPTVYVDMFTAALYTVEEEAVAKYRTAFEGISAAALSPDDTKTAITLALKEMEAE